MESVSKKIPLLGCLTKFDGTKGHEMRQAIKKLSASALSFFIILNNPLTSYFLRGDEVYAELLLQSV